MPATLATWLYYIYRLKVKGTISGLRQSGKVIFVMSGVSVDPGNSGKCVCVCVNNEVS